MTTQIVTVGLFLGVFALSLLLLLIEGVWRTRDQIDSRVLDRIQTGRRGMKRKRTSALVGRLFVGVALLLGGLRPVRADDAQDANRLLYLRYCGACHGPHGKGDGTVGTLFQTKPTDLTQIAKKHGGEFPTAEIEMVIDGRTATGAHGAPDMPVWGEVLREEAATSGSQAGWQSANQDARRKLAFITAYIKSIQEKK